MVPLLGKFIRFRNASDYMWAVMDVFEGEAKLQKKK